LKTTDAFIVNEHSFVELLFVLPHLSRQNLLRGHIIMAVEKTKVGGLCSQ